MQEPPKPGNDAWGTEERKIATTAQTSKVFNLYLSPMVIYLIKRYINLYWET